MRYSDIKLVESKVQNVQLNEGARIDHAEDIVFWEGSRGAMRAVEALKNLEGDSHKDVTLKWDGSPAIIFGRSENGEFIFTDKSGFGKKGGVGRTSSPDALKQELLGRSGGKNKDDPGRIAFANSMATIFSLYEKAVPSDFRGYFKGDLLYYNTPQVQKGNYVFKPNIVEYAVDVNSDLGKRIGASTTGVVVHREVDAEGNEGALKNADIFQGNDVLVVPPVTVERPAEVNNTQVAQLEQLVKKNAAGIDELLNTEALQQMQLSDFAKILYAYTNSKVDTGLTNLGSDFVQWVQARNQLSQKKKDKIVEYISQHQQAFNAMCETVTALMAVKDNIIQQFDKHDQTVKSNIPGMGDGGEGYVLAHPEGDIKLVPREFFTKANRAVQR
jgi:hypothetical protein